jgi:hypothetical protein
MCGAVRYEIRGAPDRILNCHCASCRKHTGAPMATLAVLTLAQVEFSGQPRALFKSAPGVERGFCRDCGSTLTWETEFSDEGRVCAIHISSFDVPDELPPNAHSFYPEKRPWFEALDDLPRHQAFVRGTEPLHIGPPAPPVTGDR